MVELDWVTISALVVAGIGIISAIIGRQKYNQIRDILLEIVDDTSEFLIMVHAISKSGNATPEQLEQLRLKAEEIWTHMKELSPLVAEVLKKKEP